MSRTKEKDMSDTNAEILSLDAIIAKQDLEERVVFIPQWGGSLRVRGITKAKQQKIREDATFNGEMDTNRFEVFMFIESVVEPQFTKANYEDLRAKSAAAFDIVMKVAYDISGMKAANPTTGENSSFEDAERSFRPGQ